MKRMFVIAGLLLCACDDASDGEGTLRVTAWGEAFIEEGIPEDAFVDGWSVTFDAFVVSVGAIDAQGAALPGTYVVDLARPSGGAGQELGPLTVPAGQAPALSWSLVAASGDAVTDLDGDVLDAMVGADASIWARGVATRGNEVKTFDWALDVPATYVDCDPGVSVGTDQSTDGVLTVHADHLFYDDLDSEEPGVAFDLIAASDADGDGAITMAELRAQSLSGQTRYQVGGRDIADLHGFILAQARTVGHINGEGHCEIE
ncbi:MAG: hypothetical protein ACRBN8_13340 [Nannocystales bacterium]